MKKRIVSVLLALLLILSIIPTSFAATSTPAPPSRISSIGGASHATVCWNPVDGVYGYQVYRSAEENGKYLYVGCVTKDATYYLTFKSDPGTWYFKVRTYVLDANQNATFSELSESTCATVGEDTDTSANTVSRPAYATTNAGEGCISVCWGPVDGADGYDVYYKKSYESDYTFAGSVTTSGVYYKTISGLTPGLSYSSKVCAFTYSGGTKVTSSFTTGTNATVQEPSYERTEITTTKTYTVYITRTGHKYHSYGCQYVRKSRIAIDKAAAIAAGYTSCSRCCP